MPRHNVWLPDDLDDLVHGALAGVSLSTVLQEALRARLDCDHAELVCPRCGRAVERSAWTDELLSAFYVESLWELAPLVNVQGTAEGACRLLKHVAERHRLSKSGAPLPRPPRRQRGAIHPLPAPPAAPAPALPLPFDQEVS